MHQHMLLHIGILGVCLLAHRTGMWTFAFMMIDGKKKILLESNAAHCKCWQMIDNHHDH